MAMVRTLCKSSSLPCCRQRHSAAAASTTTAARSPVSTTPWEHRAPRMACRLSIQIFRAVLSVSSQQERRVLVPGRKGDHAWAINGHTPQRGCGTGDTTSDQHAQVEPPCHLSHGTLTQVRLVLLCLIRRIGQTSRPFHTLNSIDTFRQWFSLI